MVLSALRVDVPLNDIHDIYENMILETPRKFKSRYSILFTAYHIQPYKCTFPYKAGFAQA